MAGSEVRKRPLSATAASMIASYLMEQKAEVGAANVMVTYTDDVQVVSDVSPEMIQKVSVDPKGSVFVAGDSELSDGWCRYSSENMYAVSQKMKGQEISELFLDELMERSMQQPQKEKAAEKAAEKKPEEKAPAKSASASKGKSEFGSDVLMLVGVSKRALRFRRDEVTGTEWVNVAVPWKAGKNGLGHIDIPKADFDKANPPTMKRNTYHIPLLKEEYGIWYRVPGTDKAEKPTVSAAAIREAYEENRSAYRKAQEAKQQEPVQEASGKEAAASGTPRDLPKVADKMEETGPEFDFDMDL